MKNILLTTLFILFCAVILVLSLRGIRGNPTSETLNEPYWKDEGPLELSPDRGRYALTYSIVEDKSFFYSLPVARFTTPDLGYSRDKYVSLFAPGVSFLVMPGYILGKYLNLAQVGTFAVISLFALANTLLLRSIAIRLGAFSLAATIAATLFIFASPAFSYAVTLYQHHISTFLILMSIYLLIRFKSLWSLLLIWFLAAASIPVDYPNLFLMFPIGLYALTRFIIVKKGSERLDINLKLAGFATFIGTVLPILFFLWFNQMSYGNPLQYSGTVPGVRAIDDQGRPVAPSQAGQENIEKFTNPQIQEKSAVRFFKSRNLLSGFKTHFISLDRGVLFYTPVMLFGLIGIIYAYRRQMPMFALLVAILGVNILLYSMWGDPYGGWAFGSRYLIPSYAILSIFVALLLTYWNKKVLFLIAFIIVAFYSIAVNTLGAVTTSAIPPKAEVLALEKLSGIVQRYTYQRNWGSLLSGHSKSFVYQTYLSKYLSALQFYQILTISICLVLGIIIFYFAFTSWRKGEENV